MDDSHSQPLLARSAAVPLETLPFRVRAHDLLQVCSATSLAGDEQQKAASSRAAHGRSHDLFLGVQKGEQRRDGVRLRNVVVGTVAGHGSFELPVRSNNATERGHRRDDVPFVVVGSD